MKLRVQTAPDKHQSKIFNQQLRKSYAQNLHIISGRCVLNYGREGEDEWIYMQECRKHLVDFCPFDLLTSADIKKLHIKQDIHNREYISRQKRKLCVYNGKTQTIRRF